MSVTLGESLTSSGSGGRAPGGAHQRGQHLRLLAELDAAALHVRAGGVHLDPRDARHAGEALAHLGVALDLGLEDARDHGDAFRQRRQLVADEGLDADVLEADRVQHPGRRLGDARRRVPGARLEREALGDEAADPAQVQERRQLAAVAEGARGRQHRVAQRDAARGRRGCRAARSRQRPPRRSSRRRRPARRGTPARSLRRPAAPRTRGRRRSRRPCGSRATPRRAARPRPRAAPPAPSSAWDRRCRRARPPRSASALSSSSVTRPRTPRLPSSVATRSATPSAAKSPSPIRSAAVRAPSSTSTRARRLDPGGELVDRGDPGAAGDQQRPLAGSGRREGAPERADHPQRLARERLREQPGAAPDAPVEDLDLGRRRPPGGSRKTAIGRGSSGSVRSTEVRAPGESITNWPGRKPGQPGTRSRSRRFSPPSARFSTTSASTRIGRGSASAGASLRCGGLSELARLRLAARPLVPARCAAALADSLPAARCARRLLRAPRAC